jgi:5-methylcytosine-specific restriction endonuclease McrA
VNEKTCRRIVRERPEDECEYCAVNAQTRGLTVHHRKKRSQGGEWTATNCVVLCGHGTTPNGCHSWVEHHPNDAADVGLHVRPWQTPALIPVFRQGEWVLLDDHGDYLPVPRPATGGVA